MNSEAQELKSVLKYNSNVVLQLQVLGLTLRAHKLAS